MKSQTLDNSRISKHLGQTSQYKSTYDRSLLVREPRQSNRTHLNINDDDLPFVGNDTWNAYEVSALTDQGLPVTGIAKIVYPCNGKYIVESKSIKLYFNSYNMTRLGATAEEVRENITQQVIADLSDLLEVDVKVRIASNSHVIATTDVVSVSDEWQLDDRHIKEYLTIEDVYPVEGVEFSVYNETPELLKVLDSEVDEVYYHSTLLKSNCRVTSQPDWGDVYIYIKGKKTVDPISLLQYIVSFRDECHFHEEICEAIYKRLWDALAPDELCVRCLYARRGGIDINPERASDSSLLHSYLQDPTFAHIKTPKQ
jgi:7-cyano-7-deazaguanine reductase